MRKVLCLLIMALVGTINAQVYPVQVNTQLIPPYSLRLSDYATAMGERLIVQAQMVDVNEVNRQLRFRLTIAGNGLTIRSNDFVVGAAPVFMDGGVPLRLSNVDLRPYFELRNLNGITPQQYNNPLPDGNYRFCFEVFDQISGQRLSGPDRGCFNAFLMINDPPLLNLPRRGDLVEAKNPQNILFDWTPRHLNANGVLYEFELREVWDVQVDPQAAFLAGPDLFHTTTQNTTLLYGPGETALLENRTYAWRVRAVVTDGISETSVFRNNGHSEIYHFTYTADCGAPQFALARALSTESEEITWMPSPGHLGYHVQYRKKGTGGAVWFETTAVNPHTTLYNLEPGTTYEYRVGGQCALNVAGAAPRYSYSAVQEFTTPTRAGDNYYNCGLAPEVNITNREPLGAIGVNEVFTAGDFPVTVKWVEGSNGTFSGSGYIVVPYLADTKIAVVFTNIRINTDYQLVEGMVETGYDPSWASTADVSDELKTLDQLSQEIVNAINEAFDNGRLDESERDAQLAETKALMLELEQAKDELEQGEKLLEEESQEKKEEGKQNIASAEQTTKQVGEQLREKAKELGVEAESGTPLEDSYFDALLPISVNGEGTLPINILDGNGTFELNLASNDTLPTIEPRTFTIDENAYTFYITSSKSSNADIASARQAVENPANGVVVYLHYDLEEAVMGYKVEFAPDHFGELSNEEREEARFTFKQGIANLIEAYQMAQEVEDWSVVISESVQNLNKQLKEAVASIDLPKGTWYPKDEDYPFYNQHLVPVVAGVVDGALDELKSIPQLINVVTDFATDQEARNQMIAAFEDLDIEQALDDWITKKEEIYSGTDTALRDHEAGKDGVAATVLVATAGVSSVKIIKKGVDYVEELAGKIKRMADGLDDLAGFIGKSLVDKLKHIDDVWKTKYPIPDMLGGRSFFEDIMAYYRYTKSSGWKHTGDISFNFKGVDFYKGTEIGNQILAETAVSMKTTIQTDVNKWLNYQSIKDNIEFLREGLSETGLESNKKIMFISDAKIHIYMPKANVTQSLKAEWINKLSNDYPYIDFEIKILEDFIN